jgi:hypothetical protein
MNSTNDAAIGGALECVCLPNTISISISVIGIVLPLLISEILPFCPCPDNGILHAIKLRLGRNSTSVKNVEKSKDELSNTDGDSSESDKTYSQKATCMC